MTGTGFVILGGPGAEVWQLSPTFRISFTSLLALILCSINHSAVRLCSKNVHKKNVATPFDATTSFLRLEQITQWEYITRKPPQDILCINQQSRWNWPCTSITYLQTYHQYAVSSKLELSNCLILPPSYPQTCTNINQTLFSGSKWMPFSQQIATQGARDNILFDSNRLLYFLLNYLSKCKYPTPHYRVVGLLEPLIDLSLPSETSFSLKGVNVAYNFLKHQ